MALDVGALHVGLEETLVNEGEEVVPYVWGHHPAFGPPFLAPGCRLELPAAPVTVSEGQPHGRYRPGRYPSWPTVAGRDGRPWTPAWCRGRRPERWTPCLSICAAGRPAGQPCGTRRSASGWGWSGTRRRSPTSGAGKRTAAPGATPYYGRTYHLAVEPFNAPIGSLEDAQRAGSGGALAPGEAVAAWLRVGAILGDAPATGFGAG